MKKYFVLLICIVVLIACSDNKDEGPVTYGINNYTDFKLYVSYQSDKKNYLKEIYANFNGQFYYNRNSSTLDKGDHFLDEFKNFNISINDSFKITKDYLKRANWSFYRGEDESILGTEFTSAIYIFYLDKKDIEKIK